MKYFLKLQHMLLVSSSQLYNNVVYKLKCIVNLSIVVQYEMVVLENFRAHGRTSLVHQRDHIMLLNQRWEERV